MLKKQQMKVSLILIMILQLKIKMTVVKEVKGAMPRMTIRRRIIDHELNPVRMPRIPRIPRMLRTRKMQKILRINVRIILLVRLL